MAKGYLTIFSAAELATLKADALTALQSGAGRVVSSVGAGDTNVTKEWMIPPAELLEEIKFALQIVSPASYPRTTRTVARYR